MKKLHESGFQCNVDINHDSNVNILGEKYKDVYSNKQNETRRLTELYYNNHFGIVGFKDLDLTLWKFDHFE